MLPFTKIMKNSKLSLLLPGMLYQLLPKLNCVEKCSLFSIFLSSLILILNRSTLFFLLYLVLHSVLLLLLLWLSSGSSPRKSASVFANRLKANKCKCFMTKSFADRVRSNLFELRGTFGPPEFFFLLYLDFTKFFMGAINLYFTGTGPDPTWSILVTATVIKPIGKVGVR